MNTLYLFSGIGCSDSVFEKMTFPAGYRVFHIEWKEPLPGEDFPEYCARLVQGIDFGPSDILCGVSLGGIVAQQIARQRPQVTQVAVISSAVSPWEYGAAIRLYRALGLWYITPWRIFLNRRLRAWLVSGRLRGRHIDAAQKFFAPLSERYYRFAVRSCLSFPPADAALLQKIRRIHGRKDLLFPAGRLASPAEVVEEGTHLIVYTHARRVSEILDRFIRGLWNRSGS